MKTPEAARASSLFGRSLTPIAKGSAPEHIEGDLCRMEDGKFGACSGGEFVQIKGSGLEHFGPKEGTVPGGKFRDKTTGREFIVKVYPKPEQAAVEAAANALYTAAGIRVPPSAMMTDVKHDGEKKVGVANEILPGLEKGDPGSVFKARRDLAAGFGVDALLANWDVIGQQHDNIGFLGKSNPVRLDNGGSMFFRAQGGKKDWPSDRVDELKSMLDPNTNARTGKIYGAVFQDDPELHIKALERVGLLTDKTIASAVHTSGMGKTGLSPGLVIDTLKGRRDAILATAKQMRADMVEAAKPTATPADLKAHLNNMVESKLPTAHSHVISALKGMNPKQLTFAERTSIVKGVMRKLLKDPTKQVNIETVNGSKYHPTKGDLAEKIMASWSGSAHGIEAQWFRQVAMEHYGRDESDEYVAGGKYWMKKVPDDVRDVGCSIKAASEALFMRMYGLKDRADRVEVWRGIGDKQGQTLNKQVKALGPGKIVKVDLNSLQSFAVSEAGGSKFAGHGGVVIKDEAKAKQVWGFGGFGYAGEEEVVLGRKTKRAYIKTDDVILKSLGILSLLKDGGLSPLFASMDIIVIPLPSDEEAEAQAGQVHPGALEFILH